MTLDKRLATLEADRRRQCARDWQRVCDLFGTLPADVLEALARGDNAAIPESFDNALNECFRLVTPEVEAWHATIAPPGHPRDWTADQFKQLAERERLALR